ncbi:MAG: DUF2961 domain-containing protein [Planctomycetes bacterium]|nr:DUF2961 domain-containing protein [Planctomycetota bacterium]
MRSGTFLLLTILIAITAAGCSAPTITTATLLREMTDLGGLAEFPDPPFTCKQFSSYDRKSVSREEGDTWFANYDRGQFLRVEQREDRKEYVMMDVDGPGAIVRIWSANPKGTLRIYLDHSETPVIEAPMTDVLGGKYPGIPEPIAGVRARGWNSYFPIPYLKHCKVTSDEGDFYYHVNYRTYADDARVESFALAQLEPELTAQVCADLRPVMNSFVPPETLASSYPERERGIPRVAGDDVLEPGETLEWTSAGSKEIRRLKVSLHAEDEETALRTLVLRMSFDGHETVECPLGDFFCAAPGLNDYTSLATFVWQGGVLNSAWVMPFRRSAKISIANTGLRPVGIVLGVRTESHRWSNDSMYFHAQWKPAFQVPTRPMQDWNYVDIQGKGVFVGAAFSITNPVKIWWGEGDEKIYIDGEEFPSHFGTGTEDYFGYAWGSNETFMHAYHGQPRCDGPGNYGHTSLYRWHILDRIPFHKSFRFDMELWHWAEDINVDMSVVTYWYARPGATSNRPEITPDMLRVPTVPPYVPPRVAGALEGEEMKIVAKTGTPEPQALNKCSNEHHLWWKEAQPGDKLLLEFEVPRAGRYRVLAHFVKSYNYGIHQLTINGVKAGEPLDLYDPKVTVTDEISLGEFDLPAGANRLGVEIVGTNENVRSKDYMFGLDYLRLEPAR